MDKTAVILNIKEFPNRFPEAARKCGFNLQKFNLVLIKPNICGLYHPSIMILSSILHYLEDYAEETVIGETPSALHDTHDQFLRLGINNLVKEFRNKITVSDLSEGRTARVKVPHPHVLSEIEFSEKVLKADLLVDVPQVGTHSTTQMTCALKNLFGLLPAKRKYGTYHPLGMDNVIADISQVMKPRLNVVDADKKVIVGADPLSVDIVACRFLNLDPFKIRHLELVSKDRGENLKSVMQRLQVFEL